MGFRRGWPLYYCVLLISIAGLLATGGCGTGNRLDTDGDGPGGGQFLPTVHQADSGEIALVNGLFNGAGNDLILSDPFSLVAFRLMDQAIIGSSEQIYDTDGDGDLDYIILVIRALSAHAAANVTAVDQNSIAIDPLEFNKIAGAAFEPLDATFSIATEISLPINPNVGTDVGDTLQIFKFNDNYEFEHPGARSGSDDIGTGTGVWEFVDNVVVEEGPLVRFDVSSFGQYCAVATEIVHDEGEGGDV